jgi:hypothetical protein
MRLGRVAPYDQGRIRFSLIYYQTEGDKIPKTTAYFLPNELPANANENSA